MKIRKYVFWNCSPQLKVSPEYLIAAAMALNKIKHEMIPIMVEAKANRILEIVAFEWLITEMSLIDNTGNTQGIILRIAPPIMAIKMT